jgi:hypothetical protein
MLSQLKVLLYLQKKKKKSAYAYVIYCLSPIVLTYFLAEETRSRHEMGAYSFRQASCARTRKESDEVESNVQPQGAMNWESWSGGKPGRDTWASCDHVRAWPTWAGCGKGYGQNADVSKSKGRVEGRRQASGLDLHCGNGRSLGFAKYPGQKEAGRGGAAKTEMSTDPTKESGLFLLRF